MHKLNSILGFIVLAGCASSGDDRLAPAAANDGEAGGDAARASTAPVKVVEMASLESDRLRCEDLTRPGTRIVVARRCQPIDEEALAETLNQVRRDQETLDRLAREREGRRRGF